MSGITGVDRLRKDAAVFREYFNRAITDELQTSTEKPIVEFRQAVDESIQAKFPKGGGYAGIFGGSWNILVKTQVVAAGLRIRMKGTAHGHGRIRDSAALNRGVLRHKTYGHLPWRSQAIPPRFWDEPAERLINDIGTTLQEVAEKVAKKVEAQL